jgi:hypothetical protein
VPGLDVPIFVALDEKSKKNVGHSVAGLKKDADWSVTVGQKELKNRQLTAQSDASIASS